ncbi:hypothetical protein [Sporomusa acidovorans]|nr:hypothetical protein [Sporomusa acidovorans]
MYWESGLADITTVIELSEIENAEAVLAKAAKRDFFGYKREI